MQAVVGFAVLRCAEGASLVGRRWQLCGEVVAECVIGKVGSIAGWIGGGGAVVFSIVGVAGGARLTKRRLFDGLNEAVAAVVLMVDGERFAGLGDEDGIAA